jgi:hypothetical protein
MYTDSVRTSQETLYISATKTNRLKLFRELSLFLWESYGTHKFTVWAECREFIHKNPVRTSQETLYVSVTKPNRLMLFGEIIDVFLCETHTEHTNTLRG